MKSLAFITPVLLILCSCSHTVEFVRRDTAPQKQAVVRYYPTDKPETEAKYREDLKSKATNYCGGEYTITKEYQARDESNTSAGVATGFGIGGNSSVMFGGSGPRTTMYNFVEFTCK
ncbi:MAG: hypothetical protein V4654_13705 [Bdellovibrionota bacterium]